MRRQLKAIHRISQQMYKLKLVETQEEKLNQSRLFQSGACPGDAPKAPKAPLVTFKVGDEVTINVRDKYCGMRGILEGWRGSMFWNIRLLKEEGSGELIYKMASSF